MNSPFGIEFVLLPSSIVLLVITYYLELNS